MDFDTVDKEMRQYETAADTHFIPDLDLVVRLDGRSFTTLTGAAEFAKPFDDQFHSYMVETARLLMTQTGFKVKYAMTHSDEISLWLPSDFDLFERKERKLLSILAGSASAFFTLQLGQAAVFDARVCQLPNLDKIRTYFSWRQEDARRNGLNSYCYWILRQQDGLSGPQAARQLRGATNSDKNELLFKHGINFNTIPAWQKRGTGLYWETYKKQAENRQTHQLVEVLRNRLVVNEELPVQEEYRDFVAVMSQLSADMEAIA